MKKISTSILLASALLSLSSCNLELMPGEKKGPEFVFKTTTEMQEGDLAGIFIDRPVLYRNVKATYSASTFTTNSQLYWPVDMPDSLIVIRAYAPYDESYNNVGVVSFSVQPDQTEDAAYKASDMLYSETMASPSSKKVNFDFDHRLSKLVIYVQSVVDSPVDEVVVTTVYPSVFTNFETDLLRCTGDKMDIKGHLSSKTDDGVCAYEFIVAPQTSVVSFTIKAGDTVCSATSGDDVILESGYQYVVDKLIQVNGKRKRPYPVALAEQKWAQPDFVYAEPAAEGTEFTDLSEYGLYKVSDGMGEEAFSALELSCQTAVFYSSKDCGFRAVDFAAGQYFQLTLSSASVPAEGNKVNGTLASFGIEEVPASLTAPLTVVKKDGKTVWLADETNELGYIIKTK